MSAVAFSQRFQWLVTSPNPHVRHPDTADDGQRGWRLHAVAATDTETFADVKFRRAACGTRAAHGWALDLFILTETEWRTVFDIRCRSKRGESLSVEEWSLCNAAFKDDDVRYSAMSKDVFDETAPFGSRVS